MSETLAIRVNAENPNHHLWSNGLCWWIHYTVHTNDGRKRRVRYSLETTGVVQARLFRDAIFALWSDAPPAPQIEVLDYPEGPADCPQPDAKSMEFIAATDRGSNPLGTLVDTLYTSTESDGDRPPSLVLWYEIDATQTEEGESYTYPLVRAPLADFFDRNTGSIDYRAGAAALLHAWVKTEPYFFVGITFEVEDSRLLDEATIRRIIDRACRELPL
ncbi:MAG TPA: hypothetical protein EYQ27_16895 [Gemmatimonadetes bacterium]|nr:hypothetical protein [Gemmatimonadota bacterium]